MLNPFIAAESSRLGVSQNLIATNLPETYSQAGEDLMVEALLSSIALKMPLTDLYYLEIGANHPIQTSNTYLLYKKYNGHGVLFEADPDLVPALEKVRPRDQVVCKAVSGRKDSVVTLHVANAKELSSLDTKHVQAFSNMGEIADVVKQMEVPNLYIGDLLAQYGQQTMHYLSIDVEGEDLSIMQAIDFDRYRPWILSCEPSPHIYPDNPRLMFQVMAQAGYHLVARTFVNMIFMDKRWL